MSIIPTSIETVMQIARQLQAEGKQPSVALVKARVPAPCPMPDVISGLQRWRQQSSPAASQAGEQVAASQEVPLPQQPSDTPASAADVQQLRNEVASLREEIVMLRRSIRLLNEQPR